MPPTLPVPAPTLGKKRPPEIVLALDVAGSREAFALLERVPEADFVKVGLQLFTAAGPDVVRALKDSGRRVFLDLKLHDIPNTVARAVESAAALGVDLLTLHASGGAGMLRAAGEAGAGRVGLLAVTVLTSLGPDDLRSAWGRASVSLPDEVARLASLAARAGLHGVVASVAELEQIRARAPELRVLTPGIRLAGDAAGDQRRTATPADAARLGADYLVVGRSVSAAPDPAAAFRRVRAEVTA